MLLSMVLGMGLAVADCPAPDRFIPQSTLDLVRTMDEIDGNFPVVATPPDHGTPLGTVIDRSCLTGTRAPLREQTIEKIERALNYAVQQISRCDSMLGAAMVQAVIPRMRRTVITCDRLENLDGYNPVLDMRADSPTFLCNRSASHSQSFVLAALPVGANWFDTATPESIASMLVHESMHSGRMGNTTWHMGTAWRDHPVDGCSNSLYHDRIYLLQAACFPTAGHGTHLYTQPSTSSPASCPGLCEGSFTQVDSTLDLLDATIMGTPTAGLRHSATEASHLCGNIRNRVRAPERRASAQLLLADSDFDHDTYRLIRATEQPLRSELMRLTDAYVAAARDALTPGHSAAARPTMQAARDALFARLDRACRAPDVASAQALCANQNTVFRPRIGQTYDRISGLPADEIDFFAGAP